MQSGNPNQLQQPIKLITLDFDDTLTNQTFRAMIKKIISDHQHDPNIRIGIVTLRSIFDDFNQHPPAQFIHDIETILIDENIKLDFIASTYELFIPDNTKPTVKEAFAAGESLPIYGETKSEYIKYRRDHAESINKIARGDLEEFNHLKKAQKKVIGKENKKNGIENKLYNDYLNIVTSKDNKGKVSFKSLQIQSVVNYYQEKTHKVVRVLHVDDAGKTMQNDNPSRPSHVDAVNNWAKDKNLLWESIEFIANELDNIEKKIREFALSNYVGYKIVLGNETIKRLNDYKNKLSVALTNNIKINGPGTKLSALLRDKNISSLSDEEFLALLIQTKNPIEFAERLVENPNRGWNDDELTILAEVGIVVPHVTIYDNGVHRGPGIKAHPSDKAFVGNLLFTPGALLVRHDKNVLPDYHAVINSNGDIDDRRYYELYRKRWLPLLHYVNNVMKQNNKKAFITMPGIGCGEFAGRFQRTLGAKNAAVIDKLLSDYGHALTNIQALYYNYHLDTVVLGSQYQNGRRKIHHMDVFMRDHRDNKSQLLFPKDYQEDGDDYNQCEFYSFVAWDHVSWPGNDFYALNNRKTDDGVKAAASATMRHVTNIEGRYDDREFKYLPPISYNDWQQVVNKNKIQLVVKDNLTVINLDDCNLTETKVIQIPFSELVSYLPDKVDDAYVRSTLWPWISHPNSRPLSEDDISYLKQYKGLFLSMIKEMENKNALTLLDRIFDETGQPTALRRVFFSGHVDQLDISTILGETYRLYLQLKDNKPIEAATSLDLVSNFFGTTVPRLIKRGLNSINDSVQLKT